MRKALAAGSVPVLLSLFLVLASVVGQDPKPVPPDPPAPKPAVKHAVVKIPKDIEYDGTRWLVIPVTEHYGGPVLWDIPDQFQIIDFSVIFPNANLGGAKAVVVEPVRSKINPVLPGKYLFQAWTAKNDAASPLAKCWVNYQPPGPQPPVPPGPNPPVPPGPVPPGPAPLPVTGLHVLLVSESADRTDLTKGQRDVLTSTEAGSFRDFLDKNCSKTGGAPDWRWFDPQQAPADPVWAAALARPRTSLPWIVVSNGTAGYEGPIPADTNREKMIALVNQFLK